MSVDLRKIKKLIELVEESNISELEVRDGEESIRITRPLASTGLTPSVAGPVASGVGGGTDTVSATQSFNVSSPMAGTFYRAASPEAQPFVSVGQAVEVGDVICVVESMKMMNEITAERAGICTSIALENGQAIGSGQLLFNFSV